MNHIALQFTHLENLLAEATRADALRVQTALVDMASALPVAASS